MSVEGFKAAWARTGNLEAGYVNDPDDSGKETNHGITVATARAHGYTGDMKDLTEDQSMDIAKVAYWDIMRLDDVEAISASVADEMFDTGFLCGISEAGIFLQRALNLFNRGDLPAPVYAELVEDGIMGMTTVHSLKLYMDYRGADGETVMLRCLNCQEGAYFMELCRKYSKDEKFVFGWYLNRVTI